MRVVELLEPIEFMDVRSYPLEVTANSINAVRFGGCAVQANRERAYAALTRPCQNPLSAQFKFAVPIQNSTPLRVPYSMMGSKSGLRNSSPKQLKLTDRRYGLSSSSFLEISKLKNPPSLDRRRTATCVGASGAAKLAPRARINIQMTRLRPLRANAVPQGKRSSASRATCDPFSPPRYCLRTSIADNRKIALRRTMATRQYVARAFDVVTKGVSNTATV